MSGSGHTPALVLAVPGRDGSSGSPTTVREIVMAVEQECPDVPVRVGYLDGLGDDCLAAVLGDLAGTPPGSSTVVVPLLTGPHRLHDDAVRRTVASSPTPTVVTTPLGPHPMLAEALHTRLSDVGLARVQHVRVLSVSIAADGVVVATSGGTHAVRSAEVTSVLLASRLAIPVAAAALPDGSDDPDAPAVADVVAGLRRAGTRRVALSPYVVGPEVADDLVDSTARALDVEHAPPLGAHQNVSRLVVAQYRVATRQR